VSNQPLCADCPDHEACLQARPCDVVKRVAAETSSAAPRANWWTILSDPAMWKPASITPYVIAAIRGWVA
jgi:hypothetical protein